MAGSHRAARTPGARRSSLPRAAVLVALVVALVPATYLTAHRVFHDASTKPVERTDDLPIPAVSPSATREPSATPAPAATTTPPPSVPTDAPRRITAGDVIDAGFDTAVTTLDASSDAEVARWAPRGSPGSPGTDTVFVVGRVFPNTPSAFAALPRLTTGTTITIRTDSGELTYSVTDSTLTGEQDLEGDPLVTTHQPGRLVLVGIRYAASGNRLADVLVVTAQLTAATAG